MKRHLSEVHQRGEMVLHKCGSCSYQTKRLGDLTRHNRQRHGMPLLEGNPEDARLAVAGQGRKRKRSRGRRGTKKARREEGVSSPPRRRAPASLKARGVPQSQARRRRRQPGGPAGQPVHFTGEGAKGLSQQAMLGLGLSALPVRHQRSSASGQPPST